MRSFLDSKKYDHAYLFFVIGLVISLFVVAKVVAVGGSAWNHQFVMDVDVSTVDASYLGASLADVTGRFATALGDVNGDDIGDMLFGSASSSASLTASGTAYLVFGKTSGWSLDTLLESSSNYDASFFGEAPGDQAGHGVFTLGDVNNDGLNDFAVGAINNDALGSGSGQLYIVFGRSSGWGLGQDLSFFADASFLGTRAGDGLGQTVAPSLGDVNSDGFADILACSQTNDDAANNAGQCWLMFGKASGWAMDQDVGTPGVADASFVGGTASESFANGVTGLGDVNSDGIDDFAIGSAGNAGGGTSRGQVYIFFGKEDGWAVSSTPYDAADATFVGENDGDGAGIGVGRLGDVNGDGMNDIGIISRDNDYTASNAGKLYVVFGTSTGWGKLVSLATTTATFVGEEADNNFAHIKNIGDINNDGLGDFTVSASHNNAPGSDAGQVYVILGKTGVWGSNVNVGTGANASFWGEGNSDTLGDRIGAHGDVNGDDVEDLILGAAGNDESYSNAGQVYVILGPTAPTLTLSSMAQRRDGSGIVDISVVADSAYDRTLKLSVQNYLDNRCGSLGLFSGITSSTLFSTVTASQNDSGGAPSVTNGTAFQIGNETNRKIVTSGGANTISFAWDSATDVPNQELSPQYQCTQMRVTDGDSYSNFLIQGLRIDNLVPTAPGALTNSQTTSSTIVSTFGAAGSDLNFAEYRIFYATTTPVTTSSLYSITSSTQSSLGNVSYNGATSITISSLTPNTQYYANIFAYDSYGNVSSSTSAFTTTTYAALPVPSIVAETPSEITLGWTTNGNPSTVEYYAENVTAGTNSGWSTATSWVSSALTCNINYTFRVRARNSAGVETAVNQLVSTGRESCGSGSGTTSVVGEVSLENQAADSAEVIASSTPVSISMGKPVVAQPFAGEIVKKLPFLVKGTAFQGAEVIVSVAGSTYTVVANEKGEFEVAILDELVAGEYEIAVHQRFEGTESEQIKITVTYVPDDVSPEENNAVQENKKENSQTRTRDSSATLPKSVKPSVPLRAPTVQEVKKVEEKAKKRKAFLLVMNKDTSSFFEQQLGDVRVACGETTGIMLRPSEDVYSITARVYPLSVKEPPKTWTGNPPWIAAYVFNKHSNLQFYEGGITIPEGKCGSYNLQVTVNGVNGSRTVMNKQIEALPKGVVHKGNAAMLDDRIAHAKIFVYKQENNGTFVLWNAKLYGEQNPVFTDESGSYAISVPAGTYYTVTEASGFERVQSEIRTIKTSGVLSDTIMLTPKKPSAWDSFWTWAKDQTSS